MYPGWLDMRVYQSTWGRVSQYAPGTTITPFVKASYKSLCFGSSVQSDYSPSIDQVHAQTLVPKQTMMT